MIKEDYVDFELAKKLKEKGFPQRGIEFLLWYDENANLHSSFLDSDKERKYIRPALSLVQKWLMEEKQIYISMCYDAIYDRWECILDSDYTDMPIDYYNSYDEALSAGINKALELI